MRGRRKSNPGDELRGCSRKTIELLRNSTECPDHLISESSGRLDAYRVIQSEAAVFWPRAQRDSSNARAAQLSVTLARTNRTYYAVSETGRNEPRAKRAIVRAVILPAGNRALEWRATSWCEPQRQHTVDTKSASTRTRSDACRSRITPSPAI